MFQGVSNMFLLVMMEIMYGAPVLTMTSIIVQGHLEAGLLLMLCEQDMVLKPLMTFNAGFYNIIMNDIYSKGEMPVSKVVKAVSKKDID